MKFREASTVCSKKGCENERAESQRYCKACRAKAMREARAGGPEKHLQSAVMAVARKRVGRQMPEEMRVRLEQLCAEVVGKIDSFNGKQQAA
ncbi:hypothetical protein ACOBR2_06565 [Telmatobacter bradus]|uniref:hypothetical protein n=1 Tax=Telmatobacter bradus TaxID=474953 RepID=UPI003B432C49